MRLNDAGEVLVSAPYLVPKRLIDRFVEGNETWIKRQQKRTAFRKEFHAVLDWEQGWVMYLGRRLDILFDSKQREKVEIMPGRLRVKPPTLEEKDVPKTLLKWLKREAVRIIDSKVSQWAETMDITPESIKYRQQRSRWGSCTLRGSLSFNWRLIHFSPEVIDYVVVHELVHMTHHNHGINFWKLVRQFKPDYQLQKDYLRKIHLRIERL